MRPIKGHWLAFYSLDRKTDFAYADATRVDIAYAKRISIYVCQSHYFHIKVHPTVLYIFERFWTFLTNLSKYI